MPSLLTPAFLAGLLALVVPILVHLRMRERKTPLPFPSLMFVRRIPHKSLRRRTLQNLPLFLARALAVTLLCLSFARPFFPVEAAGAAAPSGPVGRVIALDVSASMGYEGLFPQALAQAEQAIREMGDGDAVGVLLFSDRAEGVAPPSTDHAKALAAVRDARPRAFATRFAPALRLAGDWLSALQVDRRELVLVTDGQTKGLLSASDVTLPAGTIVSTRLVAGTSAENSAVTDVTVEPVKEADRRYGIVTARLIHQGGKARTATAGLEVSGRVIEEKSVVLPENGAISVTFARAPLPEGLSKGRVVLSPDDLAMDDTFHFVLGAGGDIPVLLVDAMPYVGRALEIGDQPGFEIARRSSLNAADLAGQALVVLGDLGSGGLGPAASAALKRFVEAGGGLLVTSPLVAPRGAMVELLPAVWGENVSRLTGGGASLGFVDLDHPALFAFKQARGSDFSRARFLQYRMLQAKSGPEGGRLKVLARFDDGRAALVEWSAGRGRALAFTTPLDGLTSDLPVQPLFLPLIHELAQYAAAYEPVPLHHRVGAAVTVRESATGDSNGNRVQTVLNPAGRREPLAAAANGIELQLTGFYEADFGAGGRKIFAANMESAESDLTTLDPDELAAALGSAGGKSEASSAPPPSEAAARQGWWRLALLAVLLLLAAETSLGNARAQKAAP